MKFNYRNQLYSLRGNDYKNILVITNYKPDFPRTNQHQKMEKADLVLVKDYDNTWKSIKDRYGNVISPFHMTDIEEVKLLLIATVV
jgi:hypothetical protein